MTTTEPKCAICDIGKVEHENLERHGVRRHRFSETGELEVITDPTKVGKKKTERSIIQIMPAPDLALRALLKSRGILSDEDLAQLDNFKVVLQTEVPSDQPDES